MRFHEAARLQSPIVIAKEEIKIYDQAKTTEEKMTTPRVYVVVDRIARQRPVEKSQSIQKVVFIDVAR